MSATKKPPAAARQSSVEAFCMQALSTLVSFAPASGAFACTLRPESPQLVDVARIRDGILSPPIRLRTTLSAAFRFGEQAPHRNCRYAFQYAHAATAPYLLQYSMPDGYSAALVVRLGSGDRALGALGLERRAGEPMFSDAEVAQVERMAPLLVVGVGGEPMLDDRASLGDLSPELESSSVPQLSRREHEVARLLVQGLAGVNIAAVSGLSENTVRTYARRLYRKLGVHNRADLVRTLLEDPKWSHAT